MKDALIRPVCREELPECLRVIHGAYLPVAERFGLTSDNCPDRGRAELPLEKLEEDFRGGVMITACFLNEAMIGLVAVREAETDTLKINDLVVLPEYQGKGCGSALLKHVIMDAKARGTLPITLGMIDENEALKAWYKRMGFSQTGRREFPGSPISAARMEMTLI